MSENNNYTGSVSIRARLINDGMGLAENGYSIMPGTSQSEPLICLEAADHSLRYVTGLDEFAPEVQKLKDGESKDALIKSIRTKVARLEFKRGNPAPQKHIDAKDPNDFWSKVKYFDSRKPDFFKTVRVMYTNDPKFLDLENEMDFVIYEAIKAGGFSMCAPDEKTAKQTQKRFYLSVEMEETSESIGTVRKVNKAKAVLDEIYEEESGKIFYLAKVLTADGVRLRKKQGADKAYAMIDAYLDGKANVKRVTDAVAKFNEAAAYEKQELMVRAIVSDCVHYKMVYNRDKAYYDRNGNNLGRNNEEIVQTLLDPANADIAKKLLEEVEKYW